MDTLIEQIMALSGAMPDPAAHRRYLATLGTAALQERLATLQAQAGGDREPVPLVEFWRHSIRVIQKQEAIHA